MMCHVLQCNQAYLLTWNDKALAESDAAAFAQLVKKRQSGHPVAHLLGYRDFWSLRLSVNPSTLIPRPETELLVEKALELPLPENARVLDLGTGTGAIALALASEKSGWQVTAVDFQTSAVALAEKNRQDNHLENVQILQSHWFGSLEDRQFDLIVSNPPYVEQDSPYLQVGDVRFEPDSALTSGADGLDDIRYISAHLSTFLAPQGWVVFEHGNIQGPAVQEILIQSGLNNVETERDLNQQPRITFGRKTN